MQKEMLKRSGTSTSTVVKWPIQGYFSTGPRLIGIKIKIKIKIKLFLWESVYDIILKDIDLSLNKPLIHTNYQLLMQ